MLTVKLIKGLLLGGQIKGGQRVKLRTFESQSSKSWETTRFSSACRPKLTSVTLQICKYVYMTSSKQSKILPIIILRYKTRRNKASYVTR